MARPSTNIVIFLFLLNASATLLTASGVAGDLGIQPDPGADERIQATEQKMKELEASGGFGATLFLMYISITRVIEGVFGLLFAGPTMLANLGVPSWLLAFVFAPQYLIVGMDVVYLLTGRNA